MSASVVVLAFLALWTVLRLVPYAGRAGIYAGVSRFLDAFRHPIWGSLLVGLGVGLWLRWRRGRRDSVDRAAGVVGHVFVRSDVRGRLAVAFGEDGGAGARDYSFERNIARERAVLTRFDELARRSVAFAEGYVGKGRALAEVPDEVEYFRREIYGLGCELGRLLTGSSQEVLDRLFDLPADHLRIRMHKDLVQVPWELLVARPGGQFLWQQFHVARQVVGDFGASGSRSLPGHPLRVLLLANLEAGRPGRDLTSAEAEACELMEMGASHPETVRVVRKSPRDDSELGQILAEGWDVVHFASHTAEDPQGAWILAGGEPSVLEDALARTGRPPILVFANACRSGPREEVPPRRAGGAALSLIRAGAGNLVGTLWELHDRGSAAFARAFYRAVLTGATLGEAVSAARNSLMGREPFVWANYVLYGDPGLVLAPRTKKSSRPSD